MIPRTAYTSRIELGPAGSASIAAGAGTARVYVGVTDSAGSAPGGLGIEEIQPLLEGDEFAVEARKGGAAGASRTWYLPTEQHALLLIEDLLRDQHDWCELTVRP